MVMATRTIPVVVIGVVGLVVGSVAGLAHGAEFRTSVRGKSLVRQAMYQASDSDAATRPVPAATVVQPAAPLPEPRGSAVRDLPETVLDSTWVEPQAEFAGSDWAGNCGAGYCESGNCGAGDCGPCVAPCFGWTYWGSFEFLLWWRKHQELPPLVTTSPWDTPYNAAGVLGESGTQILYPTDQQGGDARPGARLTLGVWLDPCELSGVGGRFYSLGEMTANYDVDSDELAILGRPFYNLTLGQEDADLVAFPGYTTGALSVRSDSDVSGGDVFFRRFLCGDSCRRIDLLAGYQFAALDSDLLISSHRTSIRQQGSIPYGTVIDMYDSFDVTNRYHAGEIGLLGQYDRGDITWSLLAKVGLGNMKQRAEVRGFTATHVPGVPVTTSEQGLLALRTNSGVYEENAFTVSPELQLNAAYRLTDCIELTCGYSFIYWNHVAQSGLAIDSVLNTTQISGELEGAARPAFLNEDAGFFVHGLNFGVQFIW